MPAARVIRSKSARPHTQRTSGFPLLPLLQIRQVYRSTFIPRHSQKNDKKL